MVLGLYFDKTTFTESVLVAARTDVLQQLAKARTGDRFQSSSGHGRSFTKDNLSYDQLREELAEINAALSRIDPAIYGRRVKRMLADFRNA